MLSFSFNLINANNKDEITLKDAGGNLMFISSLISSVTNQKYFQGKWKHSSFFTTKWFLSLVRSLSELTLLEAKKTDEYLIRSPTTVGQQRNFMVFEASTWNSIICSYYALDNYLGRQTNISFKFWNSVESFFAANYLQLEWIGLHVSNFWSQW